MIGRAGHRRQSQSQFSFALRVNENVYVEGLARRAAVGAARPEACMAQWLYVDGGTHLGPHPRGHRTRRQVRGVHLSRADHTILVRKYQWTSRRLSCRDSNSRSPSRSTSSFRPSVSDWPPGSPFSRHFISRPAARRIASSLSFGSRYSVWHSAWGSYREL